jgi:2-oxo-4-hydroxy-4-carboxy-5-ureidoimidazoline decarboxylase
MNSVLARWNGLNGIDAASEILPCCGSQEWARRMAAVRPIEDELDLIRQSDRVWQSLHEKHWDEAFRSHPRIGESPTQGDAGRQAAAWSAEEQKNAAASNQSLKQEIGKLNREYDERFGRTFIVCATGKTAPEILAILRERIENDPVTELREAAEQQRQITHIRLKKWLGK